MIRVALVSYFNTKPFSDGLEQAFGPHEMEYHFLSPADCAKAMHAGGCDVALLPVGSLLDFQGLDVLNHFCIGADGAVDSVFLFSDVPVQEVEELILDPHSRTSNGLARILFSEHWKRPITVRTSSQRPLDLVKKHTAAVMIGDLAHAERGRFKFVYDLSHEWKIMTGLPFVFAVWVCKQGGLDSIGLR